MIAAARTIRAAIGIISSTVLMGAPAVAAGLLLRLDGGGPPAASTILLATAAVHLVLALSLLWSVARANAHGARAHYWWWVASALAVAACMAFATTVGWRPSIRAMLLTGLGLLGAAITGRDVGRDVSPRGV